MNYKSLLKGISFAAVLLSAGVMSQATASITVSPLSPTAIDNINVTVNFQISSPCNVVSSTSSVAGTIARIDISDTRPSGAVCPAVVSARTITASFGQQPEGGFSIFAYRNGTLLEMTTFSIYNRIAQLAPPRIFPAHPTNFEPVTFGVSWASFVCDNVAGSLMTSSGNVHIELTESGCNATSVLRYYIFTSNKLPAGNYSLTVGRNGEQLIEPTIFTVAPVTDAKITVMHPYPNNGEIFVPTSGDRFMLLFNWTLPNGCYNSVGFNPTIVGNEISVFGDISYNDAYAAGCPLEIPYTYGVSSEFNQLPAGNYVVNGYLHNYSNEDVLAVQSTFTVLPYAPHPPYADVAVFQTVAPNPVKVGSNIAYTFTVENRGPDNVANVRLSDKLPRSIAFVSVKTDRGTCKIHDGTISCKLGDFVRGATAAITVVARARAKGMISNTATITSNAADSNPGNNTATAVLRVVEN